MQVSDRFHLWQGLPKRVSDIAAVHRGCLAAAVPEPEVAPPPSGESCEAAETPARRHAKRLFETVQGYTGTARSLSAISRELGLNRRTVAKYARAACWQECVRRTPPRRFTSLDPYLEYLRQRWEEDEHTATMLHQEIAAKGYGGHYQRVKMAIAPLRQGLPIGTPRERPPSPRRVARWITTAPVRRGPHATEALRRLFENCPELDQTHTVVRQFAAMLEARDAAPLPDWLDQLTASGLSALASLANALREDQSGSRAGDHYLVQLRRQRRPDHGPEAPEEDHGWQGRSSTPAPPRHPHSPPPTPLPVTERHRRTVAQPRFTKILPGPLSRERRQSLGSGPQDGVPRDGVGDQSAVVFGVLGSSWVVFSVLSPA
ncbi:hypothetical protein [Streptomyces sp. NPDC048442]|uniref:hypothetical protein n=1 Tax=Streptomyces sp. NPDC048442 TaxID=3154823 RepID=UPI00341F8333